MNRYFTSVVIVLIQLFGVAKVYAEALLCKIADKDSVFVYLPDGRLDVYPSSLVKRAAENELQFIVTTIDDVAHVYKKAFIDSVSKQGPKDMPTLTSFKINNKFNGQIYSDVQCEIGADGLITGSVPAIGKWLTPSFQRSDETALVYVGRQLQRSKVTRRNFAEPVEYVVTRPGWQIMSVTKIEEGEDEPQEPVEPVEPQNPMLDETARRITLSAEQLSTNAPTMRSEEDLPSIIDGNDYTFFHSTWSGSGYEPLPLDSCPWIEIQLPDAIHYLQFRYETRDASQRWPVGLSVEVSSDGETWTSAKEFTSETDGLPLDRLEWWTSPVVNLGGNYSFLRLVCTEAAYKNYFCLAELELYEVTPSGLEPGPTPQPDPSMETSLDFQPFGSRYTVSLDWPTDRAVSVPTVYITTNNGRRPYSKTVYLRGTITIDGGGVFPDMAEDSIQIRGRGNSSWAGENGKSPYRVKFDSKRKPFGLTSGKNWVLLANRQTGSMMSNAIGMKVAQLAGTAGANHIIPVELYINGEYRGNYNFTEQVSISNNSINLDDESLSAMLELDSYFDETYKFRGSFYSMPVNIKKPEFDDEESETLLTQEDIENDWNELLEAVFYGEDISNYAQVDTLAAFYLANELIMNQELMHPKSTFVYKERVGDAGDLWKFGPVWDLDWSFGYEGSNTYFQTGAKDDFTTRRWMECNQFWIDLRAAGETFDRVYYKAWTRFLRNGALEELNDYCLDYYNYVSSSLSHNAEKWSDGRNYAKQVPQAQKWLAQRAEYIYQSLNEYDLTEELPEDTLWTPYEDAEIIDDVDPDYYIRLRNAIRNVMAKTDAYTCDPALNTALDNIIQQQDKVAANAKTNATLRRAVNSLLSGFVSWLGNDNLFLKKPIDLTEVYIVNPAPLQNVDGWNCSEEPKIFDSEITHTTAFYKQADIQMSQWAALLPAGSYEWRVTALTRKGSATYIYADDEREQIVEVSSRTINSQAEARAWFDEGNGRNTLLFTLNKPEGRELGLCIESGTGDHWTVFCGFQLMLAGKPNVTSYELSYMIDGEVYKTVSVPYGMMITPLVPVAPEGYSFVEWKNLPETMPDHDVAVTASFVVNQYTITYVIDGETYKTERVDYGTTITPPSVPEKVGFPFAWESYPEVMPAHDITINGSYLTSVNELRDDKSELLFYSVDGKRLPALQRGVNIVRNKEKSIRVLVK